MVRRRSQRDRAADLLPGWVLSFDESAWPAKTTMRSWFAWREEVRRFIDEELVDLDAWLFVMQNVYETRRQLTGYVS